MIYDKNGLFIGTRDVAHNMAFYALTYVFMGHTGMAKRVFEPVKKVLFKSIFWPIKDPSYFWSNSEGWTKCIYDKILSKFGCNPRKGTNPDQTLPCNIFAALAKDNEFLRRFLIGLLLRFGFYPNFEHILMKPHHLSPIFRAYNLKPLYWITDIFFYLSVKLDLVEKIQESSTNKVKYYIFLVQAEKKPTFWTKLAKISFKKAAFFEGIPGINKYFEAVFAEYFKTTSDIFKYMKFDLLK